VRTGPLKSELRRWRKREIARIPSGKTELADFVAENVGSYWHPVGTCAMGVQPEAVVNPSLCVNGTTNLRVADASVMPTITSGNTNAPTIVIAERAAQMMILRQKFAPQKAMSALPPKATSNAT
jgi:choline dehydrogenase-like flavoprotein